MFKRFFILPVFLFFSFQNLIASDSISVYVFLHEDCPVSQYYTLQLNELNTDYTNEDIKFIGLFPNFSSKKEKIEAFRKKYNIEFELKTDYFKSLTKAMGATITPEAVIYNHTTKSILYSGRIDDSFYKVGRRKSVTTTSELKDALISIHNGKEITNIKTQAVGCFINFNDSLSN
jgi:thiol-disulfide isomerase/thioredoxin